MSETTVDSTAAADAGGASTWTLVIVGPGDLRIRTLAVPARVTIGRDPECEVRLDHPRVSRRHARLLAAETCSIEDLGSRAGVLVDGAPVTGTRGLEPGATVRIGPFALVVTRERAGTVTPTLSTLVVDDPTLANAAPLLASVARSAMNVLILGETGVGKEILASTLHTLSGRHGAIVRLNCATFHAELLESELFGHERGAFTGAVATKPGLLEAAAGGTVFLDEIGDLPLALQARLLRAIESREVLRVGGTRPVAIDARFVAATHRDLREETARATFRLDLYYRLAGVTLAIPPLRARPGRILQIAQELAPAARFTPAAVARLQAHDWPGNVRELRNVVERALLIAGGGEIGAEHVVLDTPAPAPAPAAADDERARIVAALDACAGNQTRAARLLGISRATLATKLAIHKIPRPRT